MPSTDLKKLLTNILSFILALLLSACSSDPGNDAISSRVPPTASALPMDCSQCHSVALGARRAVTGSSGDFAGNSSIVSHHVSGGSDPSGSQCIVCHDLSTHSSGTVRLKNADTGAVIAYTTPASIETFCLSCHDTLGATATFIATGSPLNPFNDGSTLGTQPYPYASGIAGSWAKTIGHGTNGNHAAADKLTCLGAGTTGTGCHGRNGAVNAHGSQDQVLAARAFTYDINYMQIGGIYTYDETHFDLCFHCHSSYTGAMIAKEDILGVKFDGLLDDPLNLNPLTVSGYGTKAFGPRGYKPPYDRPAGSTSRFLDHNETGSPLNDTSAFFGSTPDRNLHWFHLGYTAASFRGPGTCSPLLNVNCSGITCVNCHDVHGSNTAEGAVYDEMGYHHYTDAAVPGAVLGQMGPGAYDPDLVPSILDNHPTYCSFNCHPVQDVTKSWFFPITE